MLKTSSEAATAEVLTRLDEVVERVQGALARSPADETSLAWLESWRRRAGPDAHRRPRPPASRREILVRILAGGRPGSHSGACGEPADLDGAIRQAMAVARGEQPVPGFPHLPADRSPLPKLDDLYDGEVAALDPQEAKELLARFGEPARRSRLEWGETLLVVASSRGALRAARATHCELTAHWGSEAGAGVAAAAARRLRSVAVEATFDRARRRATGDPVRQVSALGLPVALAPEVVASLLDVINRRSLTAWAYLSGDSFLRDHLGVQVFDRSLSLVDDGTDPAGLPFPFDLEGTTKRRVDMVERGTPRTPALDQLHAALLGLPATPHACAGDDARAEHLFLLPGERSTEELLAAADGGIWIGNLERLECFDPRRLQIRAVVQGARRVRAGLLAEPLAPLAWEVSLLQALGQVEVGRETVTIADLADGLGGVTSPGVVLAESGKLIPLPPPG